LETAGRPVANTCRVDSRFRRTGSGAPAWQNCVHDLLAIFLQEQDVRAGKLLCHDGFGLRAQFIQLASPQSA
jgi:hypothetical protein